MDVLVNYRLYGCFPMSVPDGMNPDELYRYVRNEIDNGNVTDSTLLEGIEVTAFGIEADDIEIVKIEERK